MTQAFTKRLNAIEEAIPGGNDNLEKMTDAQIEARLWDLTVQSALGLSDADFAKIVAARTGGGLPDMATRTAFRLLSSQDMTDAELDDAVRETMTREILECPDAQFSALLEARKAERKI